MGNCFNQDAQPISSVKQMKKVDSFLSQQLQEQESNKVTLKDFLSLGEIGRVSFRLKQGQFGKVLRVKMKNKGQREYAMKVIKKADIIKFGLVEHTMLEKSVLNINKNPFVVKLKHSFQTEQKLYLVMEYVVYCDCRLVQGGQFLKAINRQPDKRLSNQQAQFCAAEVVLGLEYMHHDLKVIYRDLKPENILVTEQGHIKLTDFGLSKKYDNIDNKFFTFAGTPEYLAPEILSNSGHNYAVDWWCLGILLFEMLTGHTPFHDKSNNFRNIETNIKTAKIIYPEYLTPEAIDLIGKLLIHDPKLRLGTQSVTQIKNHAFFHGVDWDGIQNLRVPSPILAAPTKPAHVHPPITKKIFETPSSHINQTQGEFSGFSVQGEMQE